MAEKGPEDGMNEAPDFEETDGPEGKSKVSLLANTGPVQVKATIDNFYRLITNHYGANLRLVDIH